LCNASPAADSVPSLIALGATCVIAGPSGVREMPAEDFCTAPRRNALQAGEMLVELRFPPCPPHRGSGYRRFTPRPEMDIAVVGVGASVVLTSAASISFRPASGSGLWQRRRYVRWRRATCWAGQPVGDAAITEAAEAARSSARPIDDMRGTREFRLHLVQLLTGRVLRAAGGTSTRDAAIELAGTAPP